MGQENNVFSEVAKKGGKFIGSVLFLPVRATMYTLNPRNWLNSWDELKHDASNALGEIVGISAKHYRGPVRMSQFSRDLGVEAKVVNGKLIFSASRTLMGDIPNLSQKQVNEIKEKYDTIVYRERNFVDFCLNTQEIVEEVQSKNKGLSEEKVRDFVIKSIAEKFQSKLIELTKITGGCFATCSDWTLMCSVGEKLYEAYEDSQIDLPLTIIDNASAVPYITKQGPSR